MIDFHFILTVSLFIYGLNFVVDYEQGDDFKLNGYYNLLWKLKFYSLKYIGEYWSRPLLTCPVCMASFHTIWLYFVLESNYNLLQLILSIFVVAGLSRILRSFV